MVNKKPSSSAMKNDATKKGKRITMSTNFSSPIKGNRVKKSTWGNTVEVYETLVEPIVVVICTRMDKPEGSYITPMIRAFNDDATGELNNKWKILTFTSRRGEDSNAKPGERNAMKKNKESTYEWEAIVAIVNREKETANDVGAIIAKEFSEFSKNDRQVRCNDYFGVVKLHFITLFLLSLSSSPTSYKKLKGIPFVFQGRKGDEKSAEPLNKYLLDDDCVYILKRCYYESTKEDLLEHDEVMVNFFGSSEKGQEILGTVSQTQWDEME